MLISCSTGVAGETVEHRLEIGFDACLRRSNHHVQLACEPHNFALRGWWDLAPVTEINVDPLFQESVCKQPDTMER